MKRKLMTLALALCLVLSLTPSARAFDSGAARHGVVKIYVGDMIDGFRPWVTGSGFFVGKAGENPTYLVTNHHVIEAFLYNGEGALSPISYIYGRYSKASPLYLGRGRMAIHVHYDDNTFSEAYPVDYSETGDYAVLRLSDPTDQRTSLPIMLPTEEMVGGDNVYAIGYPGASGNVYANPVSESSEADSSVTPGSISRRYTESGPGIEYLQTTAVVQAGNSGGPLVHENGAVLGINTSIYTGGTDNIYNAVSIKHVQAMLDKNNIPYEIVEYGATTGNTANESGDGEQTTDNTANESGDGEQTTDNTANESGDGEQTTDNTANESGNGEQTTDNTLDANKDTDKGGFPVWAIAVIAAVVIAAAATVLLTRKKKTPAAKPSAPAEPTPPTMPAPSADTLWRVQSVAGALNGKRYMIRSSGTILMGRDPQAGIAFPAGTPGVSGRHCELWYENGSVYLRDVGSSNGTFVAGSRAASGTPVRLREGDMFWLGSENEKFTIQKKR